MTTLNIENCFHANQKALLEYTDISGMYMYVQSE